MSDEYHTIEQIMDNIVFCHFQHSLFDNVRSALKRALGWQDDFSIHERTDLNLKYLDQAGEFTEPDKYIKGENPDRRAIVDFKVGKRSSAKSVVAQMAGYRHGFDLPVIVIQSSLRTGAQFSDTLLSEYNLVRNRDIFFFNYSFQDIIDITLHASASHPGRSHARFVQANDFYALSDPGPTEQNTCGLIWSKEFRHLCLPLHGLAKNPPVDPYLNPFQSGARKLYREAIEFSDSEKLRKAGKFFEERILVDLDESGYPKLVWPRKGLKEDLLSLVG